MLFAVALIVFGLPFPLLPGNNIDIIEKKERKGNQSPFEMSKEEIYSPIDYEQRDDCDLNECGSLLHLDSHPA
jgi:hypothetical protein